MNRVILISILVVFCSCERNKKEGDNSLESTNIVQLSKDYMVSHIFYDPIFSLRYTESHLIFNNEYTGSTMGHSIINHLEKSHSSYDTVYCSQERMFYYNTEVKQRKSWFNSDPKSENFNALKSPRRYDNKELKSSIFVFFMEPISNKKVEVMDIFVTDFCMMNTESFTIYRDINRNAIVNYAFHSIHQPSKNIVQNFIGNNTMADEEYCSHIRDSVLLLYEPLFDEEIPDSIKITSE